MSISFKQLLSRTYLLDIDVAKLHPTDYGLFYLGVGLTVIGVAARLAAWFAPHDFSRQFRTRLSNWALTIGLLEVLWFGMRYQNTRALGSHLAAFIVLVIALIWLFYIFA